MVKTTRAIAMFKHNHVASSIVHHIRKLWLLVLHPLSFVFERIHRFLAVHVYARCSGYTVIGHGLVYPGGSLTEGT